jgi:hypothetical protein
MILMAQSYRASPDPFSGDRYRIRGKFSLAAGLFEVANEAGERVLFAEHPRFQSDRELTLYTDEKLLAPLIEVIERGQSSRGTFDVFEVQNNVRLGVLRGAFFSTLTGSCEVLGPDEQLAGRIARARRPGRNRVLDLLASSFSTSAWVFELGGVPAARLFRKQDQVTLQLELELSRAKDRADPRFVIACALAAQTLLYQH